MNNNDYFNNIANTANKVAANVLSFDELLPTKDLIHQMTIHQLIDENLIDPATLEYKNDPIFISHYLESLENQTIRALIWYYTHIDNPAHII